MTALLLASLALAAPVPKNAPELKWKFTKGDTFYVKYDAESETLVNGANGTHSRTVAVYKFAVLSAGDKETSLEMEYVSFHYGVGRGGVKTTAVNGLDGLKLTVTLDVVGNVTDLTGADAVAKAAANQGVGALYNEYQRYALTELFRTGPDKPARVGDSWKTDFDSPFANGLRIKKEMRGKVDRLEDGVATMTVEEDYAVVPDPNAANVLGYELKGEKNPSTLKFDARKGRLIRRDESHELTGSLNGGGNLTVTLKGKSTTSVSDKEPKDDK